MTKTFCFEHLEIVIWDLFGIWCLVIGASNASHWYCDRAVFIKGVWWMPWLKWAMKDVAGCDKPRGAAEQALIRGFPNAATHRHTSSVEILWCIWIFNKYYLHNYLFDAWGVAVSLAEYIGWWSAPRELKHLSTWRKRNHTSALHWKMPNIQKPKCQMFGVLSLCFIWNFHCGALDYSVSSGERKRTMPALLRIKALQAGKPKPNCNFCKKGVRLQSVKVDSRTHTKIAIRGCEIITSYLVKRWI